MPGEYKAFVLLSSSFSTESTLIPVSLKSVNSAFNATTISSSFTKTFAKAILEGANVTLVDLKK